MVSATHAGSRPAGQPRSLALTEFAHPAGFVSPLHVHHDEHKAFYILEGTAEVHCADEVFRVTPGQLRAADEGAAALAPGEPRRAHAQPGDDDRARRALRRPCGEPAQARQLPTAGNPGHGPRRRRRPLPDRSPRPAPATAARVHTP